jgi:hypothetical protein
MLTSALRALVKKLKVETLSSKSCIQSIEILKQLFQHKNLAIVSIFKSLASALRALVSMTLYLFGHANLFNVYAHRDTHTQLVACASGMQ